MYTVVVIDDEKRIREGIVKIINWDELKLNMIDTAENGEQGLELIKTKKPDIVITDITMPGMDGLTMIEHARQIGCESNFIILSGYNDFEYAKRAMEYGVNHYLLKPCNEKELSSALMAIVKKLTQQQTTSQFQKFMQEKIELSKPAVRRQFLRDAVSAGLDIEQEYEKYADILDISKTQRLRLLMFECKNGFNLEKLSALCEMGEMFLTKTQTRLSAIIRDNAVLVVDDIDYDYALEQLNKLKDQYTQMYNDDVTIVMSASGVIFDIAKMYKSAQECMGKSFYLGVETSKILYTEDDASKQENVIDPKYMNELFDSIVMAVRNGNTEKAKTFMKKVSDVLVKHSADKRDILLWYTELLIKINIVSHAEDEHIILKIIKELNYTQSLKQMQDIMTSYIIRMCTANHDVITNKNKTLAENIRAYIDAEYTNEDLTVRMLGENVFFMTPDYISRIFRKAMGKSINTYIMEKRIETAVEMINSGKYKIYEIASRCGFGNNSQYFGQVFKKHMGVLPSDYVNNK